MTKFKRIISRLDIKEENLVKGIQLEGLRILGDPIYFSKKYYDESIDELIYQDCIASLYGNNNLHTFISKISNSYMGINLSRGKPIKYYSSDRIAQLVGNGLLTFIDQKTFLKNTLCVRGIRRNDNKQN